MKICSHCKELKEETEFNRNKWRVDGLQSYCRPCHRIFGQQQYRKATPAAKAALSKWSRDILRRNRQFVLEYLQEHPCVDCGIDNPVVLEFDHVRGEKVGNVTKLMYQKKSLETVKAEIAKCEIRCANCHRIKTSLENGSYRLPRGSTESLVSAELSVSD